MSTILAFRRYAPRQESRHYASQVKQMLDRMPSAGEEIKI